jgi:hypothetical protein
MRKGILGSIPALLAGAGLALAQSPPAPSAAPPAMQPAPVRNLTPVDPLFGSPAVPSLPMPIFRGAYDPDNAFDEGPPEPIHDNAFIKADEPCDNCHPLFWANGEFLYWAVRNSKLPPVLTTATSGGTGALGGSDTTVLYGGSGTKIAPSARPGGRGAIGWWLEPYVGIPIGFEIGGFVLAERSNSFQTSSDANGNPVLSRPFINAITGTPSAYFVSLPGASAGSFQALSNSVLYNVDFTTIIQPGQVNEYPDFLVGFRYLNLNENIGLGNQSTLLANGLSAFPPGQIVGPGNMLTLTDSFQNSNTFYGLNLGARSRFTSGRIYGDLAAKIAVGATQEVSRISGTSTLTTPTGVSTTVPGGLLALSSNTLNSTRYDFAVVPEGNANLGFYVNRFIDIHIGYTFLYWSKVQRPTQLMDQRVNPTLVPTSVTFGTPTPPNQPLLPFHASGYWAQGLSAGVSVRY